MKKKQLSCAIVFIAFVFIMSGCAKNKESSCRTCTAKNAYTNNIVETKKVCSEQEQADFKFKYNTYPTTAICE
jgi:protein involved in sex pheromone biosynthesis